MWGHHLTVDCTGCNGNILHEDKIAAFAKDMVEALGMRAYGEPLIVRFGEGELVGNTLVQLIETSNITAHFCDYKGEAYIDVFSCKRFAPETVLEVIERHFAPEDYVTAFTERQAPQSEMKTASSGRG